MKPVSKDAVDLLKCVVPNFVKAVHHDDADSIILMLDAFNDDPVLLYAAIWYATHSGKSIMITPEIKRA